MLDKSTAIKILAEVEQFRKKNEDKKPENPVDYAIRVCEAIVAEAAGYKSRTDWVSLANAESKGDTHGKPNADLEVSAMDRTVRIKVLLEEAVKEDQHDPIEAEVVINASGIDIIVPSIEVGGISPGYGAPVFVEQANGKLYCRLYDETTDEPVLTKTWEKQFIHKVVISYVGTLGNGKHQAAIITVENPVLLISTVSGDSKEAAVDKAKEMCDEKGWMIVPDAAKVAADSSEAPAVVMLYEGVFTYLDCSTLHVLPADLDLLVTSDVLINYNYREGNWVHVAGDGFQEKMAEARKAGFSIGMVKALEYAHAAGCYWLRLDCDGTRYDKVLPIFEDEWVNAPGETSFQVNMSSECGSEDFQYDSMADTVDGIRLLLVHNKLCNDSLKRTLTIRNQD